MLFRSTADLSDPARIDWRAAGAVGEYDATEQVLVINRSQNGRAGVNVVTPLVLADGRAIAVTRGFLPLGVDAPPPPTGRVEVVGVLRATEVRRTGQPTEPPGRRSEFFRLDLPRLGGQLAQELLPLSLTAAASKPADDPALEPVPLPELTEGPHLSYAIQWIIFSVCVAVGWVLALRRSIRNRTRSAPSA